MELIIRSSLQKSLHALYRITYFNGYVYVGSCSSTKDKGRVAGVNYFGSSAVAKLYGWRKDNRSSNISYNKSKIRTFEVWYFDDLLWSNSLESEFINAEALRLGIADCAYNSTTYKSWSNRYRRGGLLLNIQDNTATNMIEAANKKLRDEGPSELQSLHYASMSQYQPNCTSKEARLRAVETRRKNNPDWAKDFVKRGQEACQTPEVRALRRQNLISKRPKYLLSDGFTGDYVQISEHLNVHKVIIGKWLRGKVRLPKRVPIVTFSKLS